MLVITDVSAIMKNHGEKLRSLTEKDVVFCFNKSGNSVDINLIKYVVNCKAEFNIIPLSFKEIHYAYLLGKYHDIIQDINDNDYSNVDKEISIIQKYISGSDQDIKPDPEQKTKTETTEDTVKETSDNKVQENKAPEKIKKSFFGFTKKKKPEPQPEIQEPVIKKPVSEIVEEINEWDINDNEESSETASEDIQPDHSLASLQQQQASNNENKEETASNEKKKEEKSDDKKKEKDKSSEKPQASKKNEQKKAVEPKQEEDKEENDDNDNDDNEDEKDKEDVDDIDDTEDNDNEAEEDDGDNEEYSDESVVGTDDSDIFDPFPEEQDPDTSADDMITEEPFPEEQFEEDKKEEDDEDEEKLSSTNNNSGEIFQKIKDFCSESDNEILQGYADDDEMIGKLQKAITSASDINIGFPIALGIEFGQEVAAKIVKTVRVLFKELRK